MNPLLTSPIRVGMRQDEVALVIGPPDEERPTSFGFQELRLWIYRRGKDADRVWFDSQNKVAIVDICAQENGTRAT